jgi:hypothetical protein
MKLKMHYTSCPGISQDRLEYCLTACGKDETHPKTDNKKRVTCKMCKKTKIYRGPEDWQKYVVCLP